MRLRTYLHHLNWNLLTVVGFLYLSIGIAWVLFGIPFEDSWGSWLQRFILVGIGLMLIVLSMRGKIKR